MDGFSERKETTNGSTTWAADGIFHQGTMKSKAIHQPRARP